MSEYKIITENSTSELEKSVQRWIGYGYKPMGSMAIKPGRRADSGFFSVEIDEDPEYSQPMIREK